jgi:hypothetical protein
VVLGCGVGPALALGEVGLGEGLESGAGSALGGVGSNEDGLCGEVVEVTFGVGVMEVRQDLAQAKGLASGGGTPCPQRACLQLGSTCWGHRMS